MNNIEQMIISKMIINMMNKKDEQISNTLQTVYTLQNILSETNLEENSKSS